jgi:glycosyltransferase involved in cell wall biosynthesis
MKILHLHWAFFPVCGGVESHLETLLFELINRGNNVELVHGTPKAAWPGKNEHCKLSYSRIMDLNSREKITDVERGLLIGKIRDAEIVHVHNLHYFNSNRARCILEMLKEKGNCVFHTIHESWSDGIHREILDWKGWSDQLIISKYIRLSLKAKGYKIGFKLLKYAAGRQFKSAQLKQEARDSLYLKSKCFTIVHPARLLPWKGADVSIRAFETMVNKGYDVQLILSLTSERSVISNSLNFDLYSSNSLFQSKI